MLAHLFSLVEGTITYLITTHGRASVSTYREQDMPDKISRILAIRELEPMNTRFRQDQIRNLQ